MKNNSLISIINIIGASATSAFLFVADYWEPFQGSLQDPIFYLSFVLPGIFFAIALMVILPHSKTSIGKWIFLVSIAICWSLIYVISIELFLEGYISTRGLQFVLLGFGAVGAIVISLLTSYFYPFESKHIITGITGLVAVAISQYVIVPVICKILNLSLNDLQSSGIIVFFWQLSLGILFWMRYQQLKLSFGTK